MGVGVEKLHWEKRLEAKLKRQAKQLGFELVPVELKAA
jgi:hypothetical protein